MRATSATRVPDPPAAVSRAQTDGAGPGLAFARDVAEVATRLGTGGNSVTLRWTRAHKGVEGNEVADDLAKQAVEGVVDAHLTRKTTKARVQGTRAWVSSHVKSNYRRYRPPRGSNLRPDVRKERKELASRHYQLLSGRFHRVLPGETGRTSSSGRWWCNSGERQLWYSTISADARPGEWNKVVWREVGKAREWKHPRAPSVRILFSDARATPTVLTFLRVTKVGRMGRTWK